ncbi:MAG: hypothetical protein K0S33_771 [Bacteroidetes bacterium]|jgi:hypothetical protein|nr:hypothetical protein [Bacteroidota bacterium]
MNNTVLIESYLSGKMEPGDRLLMDARLLIDHGLRVNCEHQQQTYELVKAYGRLCLKREITAVQEHIFSVGKHESFRQKINKLFKR